MITQPVKVYLAGPGDTQALGHELSLFLGAGDCVCLSGDLGTGKTSLARALIHALAGGEQIEVPSPTFSLVQHYDETRLPVAHFDFYRLDGAAAVDETGFFDGLEDRLSLVEWPDRLGSELPHDRIDITLAHDGGGRAATLAAHGSSAPKLERFSAVRRFVAEHNLSGTARRFLQGDASTRRYERLTGDDGKAMILMDMPARPDGPTVADRQSYSAIARLAETCSAVIAVNSGLADAGLSAPQVIAADPAEGLLLIEDLGDAVYGAMWLQGEDMAEPMRAACDVLGEIASRSWPGEVPVTGVKEPHVIPPYDDRAMLIEVDLLLEWFWPAVARKRLSDEVRAQYRALWQDLLPKARDNRPVWTLRDFHSPNLIWLPERRGLGRVGLIDTQDCVTGPAAYDLASLLQDARVDGPAAMADDLLHHYCDRRRHTDREFDETGFRLSYAIMGAQRACKILGIFHRLNLRDGKPGYLRHCPRVARALMTNLHHTDLAGLRHWFDAHLPLEPIAAESR